VLTVFAFSRLATAVPVTPGGAGVVEAVLIAGLVAAGGDREQVTAAVLVYWALTWALPVLVGAACWLWWHQSQLRSEAVTTSGRQANRSEANGMANTDRPGCQARDSQPYPVRALRLSHATQQEHITSPEENR
jgi:hypothetical protein